MAQTNMNHLILLGILLPLVVFINFYLAYLYGRKTKEFLWREYLAMLIIPILYIGVLAYLISLKIIILFIISAIFGFFAEYILGLAYDKTLNKRLWNYYRFSLEGYTSLLSIPFWGIAGVSFWLLGKMIGL